MEITEKKVIETKREIKLPAYFKDEYSVYRVYEKDGEELVDVIHNWGNTSGHELLLEKPYAQMRGCIEYDHEAAENDFNDALTNFLNKADETYNATHHDQGSDSFYHLHASLYPLNEPTDGKS